MKDFASFYLGCCFLIDKRSYNAKFGYFFGGGSDFITWFRCIPDVR